jgi:hypothetical protein
MKRKTIVVLSPAGKPRVQNITIASPLKELEGKTIGFLWNNKPNGDLLLAGIKEVLLERARLSAVKWYQKQTLAASAGVRIIGDLINSCDLVINAIGD